MSELNELVPALRTVDMWMTVIAGIGAVVGILASLGWMYTTSKLEAALKDVHARDAEIRTNREVVADLRGERAALSERASWLLDAKVTWQERARALESQLAEARADVRRLLAPMLVRADDAIAPLEDPPTVGQADREHADAERARLELERDREAVVVDDREVEPPFRFTTEDDDGDADDD